MKQKKSKFTYKNEKKNSVFLILKKITEEVYFMLVRVGQKREDVRVRVD